MSELREAVEQALNDMQQRTGKPWSEILREVLGLQRWLQERRGETSDTEQRLEEIRARAEAAKAECPGPWVAESYPINHGSDRYWSVDYGSEDPRERYDVFDRGTEPIARFVEGAITDIPFLLDHIAHLAAELRATKTALEDARTDRARVALEARKAARLESAAEIERLRAIIDAIVTGPGVEAEAPNGD